MITGFLSLTKFKVSNRLQQKIKLIKPYAGWLFLALLITGLTAAIQLSFPKAISFLIDNIDQPGSKEWLFPGLMIALIVAVIYCVINAIRFYIFEAVGAKIVNNLRNKLFASIIHMDIEFFDANETGELVSRLSSDVESLKDTLSIDIAMLLKSLIVALGSFMLLLHISVELTAILLFIIPATMVLARWLGNRTHDVSLHQQESAAQSVQIAQESISNIRIIHAFNHKSETICHYGLSTSKTLRNTLKNSRLFAIFQALSSFVFYFSIILLLWFTGNKAGANGLSAGNLASFLIYSGMLSGAIGAASGFWGEWMRALGSTSRVFDIIEHSAANKHNNEKPAPKIELEGNIEFKNVTFAYPQRPEINALQDVCLSAKAGEKIALVGHSGSGKSTMANLLLGFYMPTKGDILFDGRSMLDLGSKNIRDNLVIVEQEPSLFSGTIAENIQYALNGHEMNKEMCIQAAVQANAHDFINSFPNGYDTIIGEQGVQLSGGQKQRIAIARALIRNPKILILDEATSALDSESELLVQDALNKLMKGRTTFVIAHRLSTIANVDKIILLSKGRISEIGTHDDLIKNCLSDYYRMMENQVRMV